MSKSDNRKYRFGDFEIDASNHELLREGRRVQLKPKAFDLLLMLVENRGQLIEKDSLMLSLWPDTVVEEANLTQTIYLLRKTLGEDSFIETLPRRGYRFRGQVEEIGDEEMIVAERTRTRIVIRREEVEEITLAVLPFKSLGAADIDDYLGLGIADALITRLSRIPQLAVRPTSAIALFAHSETDPVVTGNLLKVENVLEGNIRRSGERIRVTAQLIDVGAARTLWAEKFDEEFTDIFTIEDRVSERIADSLSLRLARQERSLLLKRHTDSVEAHRLQMKASYYAQKMTPEGLKAAIDTLNQAIEVDPNFALAYASIARCHVFLSYFRGVPPRECYQQAREAAVKALELDETLAEAHIAMAAVKRDYEWNWQGATAEYHRALELSPNSASIHFDYGFYLLNRRREEEAEKEILRALELDPVSIPLNAYLGLAYYYMRRYDRAVEQCRWATEMAPGFFASHWFMGWAYQQQGDHDRAIEAIEKAVSLADIPELIAPLGHAYALAGEKKRAQSHSQERIMWQSNLTSRRIRLQFCTPGLAKLTLCSSGWKERSTNAASG